MVPAEQFGYGVPIVGVVEDISEHGLCISLEKELPIGQRVVLLGPDHKMIATLRHSSQDEAGMYHAGFEFALDHQWSRDSMWPEHRARAIDPMGLEATRSLAEQAS